MAFLFWKGSEKPMHMGWISRILAISPALDRGTGHANLCIQALFFRRRQTAEEIVEISTPRCSLCCHMVLTEHDVLPVA
ncbi:hypothetical protein KSZ_03450 [Dictyobacter formicarum]|uniref:Uncharacterized protein n=1 Tax=Dictyobacter formicarum TaxID=2778368 RepID=A0ABQ3V923_9CHLR|nr:hypothetical protein KSZ_03450 [Dictyobacter formicarum]